MAGTLGAQLIPLSLSPVLTRLYTPENFGVFSLFSAICLSITTLATFRYELAIVLPKSSRHAKFLLYICTFILCITTIITTILCHVYATELSTLLNSPTLAPTLSYLPISIFLLGLIQVLSYWHLRHKHFKLLAKNKFQQSLWLTSIQISAGFFTFTSNEIGLILGFLISQIFTALFLFTKTDFFNKSSLPSKVQSFLLIKKYSNLPILNGTNAIVDAIRINGINILIAMLFSNSLLGQFALAWRMLQAPVSLINGALSQVSFQTLAQLEKSQIYEFSLRSIKISFIAGIIPFTLIYIFSPTLFPLIFGQNWNIAGEIAQALCPWLFLNLITSPLSSIFIVIKKQKQALFFSTIYAACPLWIIFKSNNDLLTTIRYSSLCMTTLLLFYILMVLYYTNQAKRNA